MINRIAMAGVATIAALVAQGAGAADFVDTAPVVATAPILEKVNTPRQECWNEQVVTQAPSNSGSPLGAIIGGIAGGVIGHQIGSGRGNAVATGARRRSRRGDRRQGRPERRCLRRQRQRGNEFASRAALPHRRQLAGRGPRLQRHLSLQRARRHRAPAVRPGSQRAGGGQPACLISVRRCPTTAHPTAPAQRRTLPVLIFSALRRRPPA